MRFGCIADLHAGKGVERYGPERLADQLDVFTRACELFAAEQVDGVLVPGDVFEGPLPTPEQYVGVARALRTLGEIPVVACRGNGRHDSATRERNALDVLAETYGASTLTVHSVPGITYVGGVAVCALPWTPISRLVAARNGGSRDALYEEAAALLLQTARGLRAEIPAGTPAVLLAHWSVSGAVTPTGRDVGLDFGVVLDAGELEAIGFDTVVLAHIHRQQVLCDDPWIGYVGSPLPLDFGEENDEHGVWIIDLADGISPQPGHARFVPLESRSFLTIDYDFVAYGDPEPTFYDDCEFLPVRDAIVRIRYVATAEQARRIDKAALTRALTAAGAWRVEVRDEIVREDRARVQIDSDSLTELEALDLYVAKNEISGERAARMRDRTQRYLEVRA